MMIFKIFFTALFFLPLIYLAKEKNWLYLTLYSIFYAVILFSDLK
jgi:hypothetical protein